MGKIEPLNISPDITYELLRTKGEERNQVGLAMILWEIEIKLNEVIATLPHADSPDLAESTDVKGKLSEEDTKND